ncbi:MAG: 30S ribosome-binding factor RbfA [Planctomycetota bacterium]
MTHYRKDRLQSEIVKEASQILLFELKDPRRGFVTVTRAKVSDDYRSAKIFVSVMGTPKQKKLTMSGLRHAEGFVQAELARRIKMRVFPEIRFELDESIDKAFRIAEIFDKIEQERARRAGGAAPAGAGEEE